MAKIIDGKLVFYHFPKTAGQWLSAAMMNSGITLNERYIELNDCHFSKSMLLKDQEYSKYHKQLLKLPGVMVKRDPIDWYISYWRYQMAGNWSMFEAAWWRHEKADFRKNDMNKFIINVCDYFWEKYKCGFYTFLWREFMKDFKGWVIPFYSFEYFIEVLFDTYSMPFDKEKWKATGKVNDSSFKAPVISSKATQKIVFSDYSFYSNQTTKGVLYEYIH